MIQLLATRFPALSTSLEFLATGLAGITLGAYPDGLVPGLSERLHRMWGHGVEVAAPVPRPPGGRPDGPLDGTAAPVGPHPHPDPTGREPALVTAR
ncbi:MAG: hypothetical protein ABSG81_10695 [Acidimicrobiales bacterium]